MFALEVEAAAVVLGLVRGMTYGLLAVGLVLVYRSSHVINFAQGQIGAFGAAVFGLAVPKWGVPYWPGFVLAIALGGFVGAASELTVVRRLSGAPKVMTIVGTVGLAQVLLFLGFAINDQAGVASDFPQPPWMPEFTAGALIVSGSSTAILVLAPIAVVALALFLKKSVYGLTIRASAVNPLSAQLAGVPPKRMGTIAWALAGGLSAMTAILVLPSSGFAGAAAFGPALLLRALVGAVIARMHSLPVALGSCMVVGVVEGVLLWNYPRSGITELVLFVVIVLALLLQRRPGTRERADTSHLRVAPWRALPEEIRALTTIRLLGPGVAVIATVVALTMPLHVSNSTAIIFTSVAVFAMLGFTIVLLTGGGGQVSLGQFGISAVGGVVALTIVDHSGGHEFGLLVAGVAGSLVALVVGLPSLRIHGLLLAVTSLAFAQAADGWLLGQDWAIGDGRQIESPSFFGLRAETSTDFLYVAVIAVIVSFVIAHNYRRSGLGRQLAAVRDNEAAARSFTIGATRVKLVAFALSGFVAGLAGGVYIYSLTFVDASAYPVAASINVVALTALGGIGLLSGPVIGALYIIALPALVELDSAALAASSIGWLALVLYFPGGLTQIVRPVREKLVERVARWRGVDPASVRTVRGGGGDGARVELADLGAITRVGEPSTHQPQAGPALEISSLAKRYGGIHAVSGVDLRVEHGTIVGLIGPNGAGKTTLFELISGFTKPDQGTVLFEGVDISNAAPEVRAKMGLVRSFQDSQLFPTLTVHETLQVACERLEPTRFVAAMSGLGRQDRRKSQRARQLAGAFGLDSYRDHSISELSTGTRRITELACMVALRPRLLLLDEPSSGIAQSETEALGTVLRQVKEELGITLVLIEHDMSLIMGISDRIVAMAAGRVIAEGTPAEIRANPIVVASYLGNRTAATPTSAAAPLELAAERT